MKFIVLLIIISLSGCSPSGVKNKIKGKWYSDKENIQIRITNDQYIIENDSPVPEDYKFIADSLIVKGFEASMFPSKYIDTLQIIKLTSDTLIINQSGFIQILYKK